MIKNNSLQKMAEVIASLASLLALSDPAAALTTFSSAVGSYNIPDNNASGVTVPITLSGQGDIASFDSVTITGLTHTYYADLRAILSNGTTNVQLFACRNTGGTCPEGNTFFDNGGAALSGAYTFASTGTSWYTVPRSVIPTAPTYQSLQSLSAFDGGSLNNTWTLNIQDREAPDLGAFTQWSFTVTETTPVPFEFSPALGLGVLGSAWLVRKALKKKSEKV
jgi:subtilisin-like proprotein convertase family protein